MNPVLEHSEALLARARGLQERIRPVRLASSSKAGNVRAVEGRVRARLPSEKSSWFAMDRTGDVLSRQPSWFITDRTGQQSFYTSFGGGGHRPPPPP